MLQLVYAFYQPENVNAQKIKKRTINLLTAVRITLINHPEIYAQKKQVAIKKSAYQSARGKFDTFLDLSAEYNHEETPLTKLEQTLYNETKIETNTSKYGIGISKQFRSGIKINPMLTTTRTHDPNSTYDPVNNSRLDLFITMPLLNGRGEKAAAADESAAQREYIISFLELKHLISKQILNTVLAYWDLVSARESIKQLKKAESRAQDLVREIKIFIKSKKRPAADLEQILANLAEKNTSRISGEQRLFEAKQNLALAMGISINDINSINFPDTELPKIVNIKSIKTDELVYKLKKISLKLRADYTALLKKQNVRRILVDKARNNLKAMLDLIFNVGYNGLDEGESLSKYPSSAKNNIPGINCSVSLKYIFPIENNTANGKLLQERSQYEKSFILTKNYARHICSNVMVAFSALRNSSLQLERNRAAVESYLKAVKNQRIKFKFGLSTLLDLIVIEDRLTNALLNKISVQSKFMKTLARLRYETGTLLRSEKGITSFGINELSTIPLYK